MEIVQMVLCGKVNKDLSELIKKAGGKGIGLCGLDQVPDVDAAVAGDGLPEEHGVVLFHLHILQMTAAGVFAQLLKAPINNSSKNSEVKTQLYFTLRNKLAPKR